MTLLASLLAGTMALRRELDRRLDAEAAASRSAARYRLLAENSSDVILRLDAAGRLAYASPSALDVIGCEPDALIGAQWRDLALAEDAAALDAAHARLAGGAARATVQFRCRRSDATALWLEASLRLVGEAGGVGVGVGVGSGGGGGGGETGGGETGGGGAIVNIRDITWRKQAEEEMAAAARELAVLAATDGLTGLANRRCFDETLQREWRRAARAMSDMSVLLVDADWFKAYNDRYGHQGGDEALRAIAACIGEAIKRPGDLGARYGGEEFAIILPDASEAGALTVASKLRTRLAARAVIHDGAPSGLLSVSIGIATMPAHSDGDPADLVAAADAALYDAKKAGRDRVAVRPLSLLTTETVQRELSLSEIGLATGDT
jgi:diguanylate cyclase (GGDEF)-like protein/PAS domain S-box-containing protein